MKIFSFNRIIVLVLAILVFYSIYWMFISFQLKSQLSSNLERYNIKYNDLRVTGYPYRISGLIVNPNLNRSDSLSNIEIGNIKIDMNPFDISKLMVRTDKINSSFNEDDSLNFFLNDIQLRLTMDKGQINEIYSISNDMSLNIGDYNIENIKKIIFKMNKVNENGYRVFFTAVASNVLDSFKNETRILLEGKISDLSTNLNGNIQLDVSNVENNDNLFSTPLVIKNGIISVLFIPLIDLKELFSF